MTTPAQKKALLASGSLNPRPEAVRSSLFPTDFFDPCDRPQVKYEMLRAHRVDGDPVTEACRQFGFSRESFYQIQQAFQELGFSSFLPAPRGRKGPSKLKGEVLEFALEQQKKNPQIAPGRLADLIRERYGMEIHRTTVMRGMKKNGARRPRERKEGFVADDDPVQTLYEDVRREALQNGETPSGALERVRGYGVASLFPGAQAFSLRPRRSERCAFGLEREEGLSSGETFSGVPIPDPGGNRTGEPSGMLGVPARPRGPKPRSRGRGKL